MKYVKWIYKEKVNNRYKIGEVVVAPTWNPEGGLDDSGGLNFTNEENALRWVTKGDILCDVIIPEDAEVISIKNSKTPGGIIRSNKLIVTNPREISDELMHELYKKSNMPERTYFESIGALAMHNCVQTALEIIRDKVNKDNIDIVLEEYNDFLKPWHEGHVNKDGWNYILEVLEEIKSDLLISINVPKDVYKKKLSEDNVINLTGQSGSGKSYYASKNFDTDKYEIVDTDEVFSDERFEKVAGINRELGEMFRKKYNKLPDLGNDFDLVYKEILDYCKNRDKTVVIDCAQFHCVKDINILKGEIIIMRTDIDTCYKRTISRWIENHKNNNISYTEEELKKYSERKKAIYSWYKGTNEFLKKIDSL